MSFIINELTRPNCPQVLQHSRQTLFLFELLCLSNDTSFVLARSTSTPFVIVLLKSTGLPL